MFAGGEGEDKDRLHLSQSAHIELRKAGRGSDQPKIFSIRLRQRTLVA